MTFQPITGYYGQSGDDGADGGPAFDATVDCTIDCGSGIIWAGTGGGGGQSSSASYSSILVSFTSGIPGVGGRGGRGYVTTTGGGAGLVNVTGVYQAGSAGANGGQSAGGNWGDNGPTATANSMYEPGAAIGGLAGAAIDSNGNTVTITAGDSTATIKGRRI